MLASLFGVLVAAIFLAAMVYEKRRRSEWEPVGNGIWLQRRVSKYKSHFVLRTSEDIDPSSMVPALWEIKNPFSQEPSYITQHPEQLQAWWEPMTIQFAALGRAKHIKSIRFAPTLGIHILLDDTKKTQRPPGEDLLVTLLEEARATWKPRRFDVDSSYHIRESLLTRWFWPVAVALGVVFHGTMQYRYIDFFGDRYYIAVGVLTAILAAVGVAGWFYPKMDGSIHRPKALAHISALCLLCLGLTLPYALIWTNMQSTRTVCEMSVPVLDWYSRSGKSRSYYATLDLSDCSTAVPAQSSVRVSQQDYRHGNQIKVHLYRGVLGRYYLETE